MDSANARKNSRGRTAFPARGELLADQTDLARPSDRHVCRFSSDKLSLAETGSAAVGFHSAR